jgi:hypothetical protein
MDGRRFDLLSRWLVNGSSRRSTLRALTGGVSAIVLSRFGLDDAGAKCTQIGKKCKSKNGKHAKCCGGAKCKGKRCKCPGGAPACGKHKTCCQPGQVCQGDFCVTGPGTCPTECCDDSACVSNSCGLFVCRIAE